MKPTYALDPRRIRHYRDERKLTQAALAEKLRPLGNAKPGSLARTIQVWERGGRVSRRWAGPLAEALGVELEQLEHSDNAPAGDWWVQQHPAVDGTVGQLLPSLPQAGELVRKYLGGWPDHLQSGPIIHCKKLRDGYRFALDGCSLGRRIELRRARLDSQAGIRWSTVQELEESIADRAVRDILFDFARVTYIDEARFPATDDGLTTVVDVQAQGPDQRKVQRLFPDGYAFRTSLQQWLREVSPERHRFSVDHSVHGVRIERLDENQYLAVCVASIYHAHPDDEGHLILAPWSLQERERFLPLLQTWHEVPMIWDGDDPIPPFGLPE